MSNMFKQNSRFAILAETTTEHNNSTSNKIIKENTRPQINYKQQKSVTNTERKNFEEKLRKEECNKIEKERITKLLHIDNFPTLCKKSSKNINDTNNASFLAKLNNSIENDINENDINENTESNPNKLAPGWISMSFDPLTNKTNTTYNDTSLSKKDTSYDVLCTLCNSHERNKMEYINLYGYDIWEKTFKSPNWEEDESYLKILDEEYEEQMEEVVSDNEEQTTGINENDKYWERC